MPPSIVSLFNINALITIGLCVLTLGIYWFHDEYLQAQREIENIDLYAIEEQKRLTKLEVQQAVKYFGYKRESLLKRSKEDIKERVYAAHALALSLYHSFRESKSQEEIEDLLRETLRHKRFNRGRGYFFATRLNGVEELFADKPELEGKNLLLTGDLRTRKVIRDMIQLVKTSREGFYEYQWTKPGTEGANHQKIAYIKHFAPFDWFIGTGEYLEDIELDIQQETLNWLEGVKSGIEDYLFVFDNKGNCLAHYDKQLVGKNLLNLQDSKGTYIVRELLQAGMKKEGDFLSYNFSKPTKDGEFHKISYIYYYERWGWIVGSGFYPDTINHIIEEKKQDFKQRVLRHFIIIILVMIVFFSSVLLVNRILSRRLKRDFTLFTDFFKDTSDISEPIKTDALRYAECKELASCINSMIERKKAAELALEKTTEDYRRLFENMTNGFALHEMIFDDNGNPADYRFIAVNSAFENLTGLRTQDLIGRTVLEIMPDTERHWIETYGRVVKTGEPVHFENLSAALGRYYEVTAYKHNANEFACIFADITERITMYKNLEELTRNLEERVAEEVEKRRKQEAMLLQQSKLAAMGEMLISISHHWRQPLNAIGLVVQAMEDYYEANELDRERIRWIVKTVMDRLNSMSETINVFSSYIQRPQLSDAFEVCSAVNDNLRLLSEELRATNIDFECSYLKEDMSSKNPRSLCQNYADIFIKGNINHFNQVIISLITNAKEALLEQQRDPAFRQTKGLIKIALEVLEEKIILKIEDNGGGIKENIMERIFEPFFTTKDRSYTLGLGLYISKLIIEEQFQGKLYAENLSGGAAFIIEIPRGLPSE